MKLLSYAALAGAGLCGAVASILLKKASSFTPPGYALSVLAAGVAALAAYGLSFILYGMSLRVLSVSTAYVSMVAVAALALLAYSAWLGETVGAKEVAGAIFVVVGVFLINWKSMPW